MRRNGYPAPPARSGTLRPLVLRPVVPRSGAPRSDGDVRAEVLPSGLTVLLRELHVAPVVEVQVWARVGAADERPGEEGLAHFHEHMLFKGTERRGVGEIAGAVEGAGGRINAYTSYDTTVYHATLPADELDAGIDVLADAVQNSVFDPAEVAREVEVVLEEIRRSEDSPHHVLADAVFATAFRAHPYRAPILGSRESVRVLHARAGRAPSSSAGTPRRTSPSCWPGDFRSRATRSRPSSAPSPARARGGARRAPSRRADAARRAHAAAAAPLRARLPRGLLAGGALRASRTRRSSTCSPSCSARARARASRAG